MGDGSYGAMAVMNEKYFGYVTGLRQSRDSFAH